MKITRLFTATLCFFVLFIPTWATGQGGKKDWGYERDSQSKARLDEALQRLSLVQPISLSPDSRSDTILNTFTLTKDGDGLRAITMGDALNVQTPDIFWFIDTETNTY